MDEGKRFNKIHLSKMLYIFAWIVEGVAVTIGLALSVITAITYFKSAGVADFSDYMNALVGTLPFVIVAIVELTKIPLSGAAYYATSRIWKVVFTFSLLFVAMITFETMLNGLERFFTAQTSGVTDKQRVYVNLMEQISDKQEKKGRLEEVTLEKIEQEYNERRMVIVTDRDKVIGKLEQDRREKKSDKDESLEQMREELKELLQERKEIREDRKNEIERITKKNDWDAKVAINESKADEARINRELDQISIEIADLRKKRAEAYEDATFFTAGAATEKYDQDIAAKEEIVAGLQRQLSELDAFSKSYQLSKEGLREVKQVRSEYDATLGEIDMRIREKRAQIAEVVALNQKDVDLEVARVDDEIERTVQKFKMQEEINLRERDEKVGRFQFYKEELASINDEVDALEERRTEVRKEINAIVEGTQVYRMAQWYSGKDSAADVDKDVVGLVAFIWFGSLSAIVAFTGIILAVASYAITGEKKERRKSTGLFRSVRRYFVHMRRRSKFPKVIEKTVEVTKEVPVDKVVLVDKPVEIIKKQIVHVPLYTNDLELLAEVGSLEGVEKNDG